MADLGVSLLLLLNRHFPQLAAHRALHAAKLEETAYQAWERAEIERIETHFRPEWHLRERRVLDVGCGLGGKIAFYAHRGARRVVALDLRPESASAARQLSVQTGTADRVDVVVADATRLPFAGSSFDIIVSVNVMEHVADPAAVLLASRRVLDRDGLAFLHFPPYLSAWGPHIEGWIHVPWPHLFFSEKTLIAALRRVEATRQLDREYIPQAQVAWSELASLPELNKLTLRQARAHIRATGWREVRHRWLPLGYQFLRDRGWLGRAFLMILQAISSLPGLREVLTTKMVFVLRSEGVEEGDLDAA